jgi:hypothetical protein
LRGAAGQPRRLFDLFRGPHWTLLAYGVDRCPITPRQNLHIHRIGSQGDLSDEDRQFLTAYNPQPGDCILVRPDGYIGAILRADESDAIDNYLGRVGL